MTRPPAETDLAPGVRPGSALHAFVARHPRLLLLSGAGCSTASGIPDYRDQSGAWKRQPPVTYQAFVGDSAVRSRYWARSFVGWPLMAAARPSQAHLALSALEKQGRIDLLVTQNVDGLHDAAGSRRVIDLHGRIDRVICLECGRSLTRTDLQSQLHALNPDWTSIQATAAPDGDADLEAVDFSRFRVPDCSECGGLLKPDVVFFGENVPVQRVESAMSAVQEADALLVVGSSLMVYSGYRFVVAAKQAGKPVAAINLGRTRADDLLDLKIEDDCGRVLDALLDALQASPPLQVKAIAD